MRGGHHKIGSAPTVSVVRAINDTFIMEDLLVDCEQSVTDCTAHIIAL